MAISARFSADFSSFSSAVQKAEVELKGFESGAGRVEKALSSMTDKFSGRKVIQDATLMAQAIQNVGGVTKLTAAELQSVGAQAEAAAAKFRAWGQEVPAKIQAIADAAKRASVETKGWAAELNGLMGVLGVGISAGAIVGFAKSLLDTGDQLVRVADRTGLTTIEVQKLSFIAGQSGNSIDELTGAIGKLQKNLLTGDQGAVTAVKALGLNLEALKAATPFEQMEQIATAIEQIPDPASRATIAMELFGKSGAAILPTLVSQFQQLGAEAPVMSDKTVRALDQAGDALAKFGLTIKVVAAESYNFAGQIFDRLTAVAFNTAASILKFTATFLEIEKHIPGVTTAFNALGISTEGIRRQAQEFNDTASLQVQNLSREETAIRKVGTAITDFEPVVKAAKESTRELKYEMVGLGDAGEKFLAEFEGRMQKALQAHYELLERIIPATRDWWELLPQLGGEIMETSDDLTHLNDMLQKTAVEELPGLVEGTGIAASGFQQFVSVLEDAIGGLNDIFQRAFEGGGGIGGAIQSFATRVAKNLLALIPIVGPILSQFGGAIVAGIKKIFSNLGGPSKDERAARDVFSQQGFKDVDAFIAAISKKGAELGIDGEELRKAVQKVLDATHISAAAESAAIDELNKKLDDAAAKAADFAKGLQDFAASGAENFNAMAIALDGDKDSLEALGAQAELTFAALVAGGMSASEAIQRLGPGLDALKKTYEELGINIEDAGLSALFLMSTIAKSNPALMSGLSGLTANMDTLLKLGLLNADAFAKMQVVGSAMYVRLQAETAKAGGTTKDALLPMQSYLHEAEKAAKELGIPLDENTQMLIAQSKELGIWKEAGKTANEVLLDGMQKLIDKVGELIDQLNGIPKKVDTTVTVTRIPPPQPPMGPPIDPGVWEPGTEPRTSYGEMGGLVTASGIQRFARGGIVLPFRARGTDTVPAMLAPGEAVLNRQATARLGVDGVNRLNGGQWNKQVESSKVTTIGSVNVHIPQGTNVNDPMALAQAILTILRQDLLGIMTGLEARIDQRIASAA